MSGNIYRLDSIKALEKYREQLNNEGAHTAANALARGEE